MPKPTLIKIRRKTKVPTKNNAKFAYRSDWINVFRIDYIDSMKIFNKLNQYAQIKNNAQFAKFLYDRLGRGIYSGISWTKGREGFRSFIKLELYNDGFQMLPKKLSQDEKELKEKLYDINKMKKKLKETKDINEREEINKEINNINSDLDLDRDMVRMDNLFGKSECSKYMKVLRPTFRFQEYQSYINQPSRGNVKNINKNITTPVSLF